MEAEVIDWPRPAKVSDPPRSSQCTASTSADAQDSVANVTDAGVEEEAANLTLERFQRSRLARWGGIFKVEGAKVHLPSGETASPVSRGTEYPVISGR